MASRIVESTTLEDRAGVFSALSDPIRLQVLDELTTGQKCVCELQETIDTQRIDLLLQSIGGCGDWRAV